MEGAFYCYVTLPQGFSDAPHMFVRITQPLMAQLRAQLIDILIYIDDTFLRAPSDRELLHNLKVTQELFANCGLTMNIEKSCLIPTTSMEFLGFIFDTISFTITVSSSKQSALLNLITPFVDKPNMKISIRHLAKIIGKIVSIFPACDKAKLHYRTLERYKTMKILEFSSWSKQICLSDDCITEMQWWKSFLTAGPIVKSLHKSAATQLMYHLMHPDMPTEVCGMVVKYRVCLQKSKRISPLIRKSYLPCITHWGHMPLNSQVKWSTLNVITLLPSHALIILYPEM